MTAWDLSDIATGTVTASSATEVDVTGSGGRFVYQITGTGFTTFDTNGFPTDGTVTGLVEDVPTKTPLTISGISISASDFMGFVNSNDATGLETAIFSGNDSFLGKAGDDVLLGFAGNDVFNLTKGGNDTASGGDGNDTFNFGATFTAADSVDGGTGTDKVTLGGDYSAGFTFGAATMVNVETLVLAAGNNYNLTLNATTNATGQSLNITASTLTAANTITIDGSATSGSLRIVGGDGNDTLTGGSGTDTLQGGNGNDTYFAGTGINLISDTKGTNTYIFSNWNSSDVIKGASGDHLVFDGDFSGGATINAAQVQGGFHNLTFDAGHSYNITLGSGAPINTFDASALASGQTLTLNASAVSGPLTFFGGNGNDVLTGNNGSDFFLMGPSNGASDQGNDIVTGGTGSDTFNFTTAFTAADTVNGVSGNDVLEMRVLGSTVSIDLTATSIQNIASLEISEFATNFTMTENDANVAAGKTMSVEFDQVAQNSVIAFNGSAETDGSFSFILTSGFPSYIVSGGAQNDVFRVLRLHHHQPVRWRRRIQRDGCCVPRELHVRHACHHEHPGDRRHRRGDGHHGRQQCRCGPDAHRQNRRRWRRLQRPEGNRRQLPDHRLRRGLWRPGQRHDRAGGRPCPFPGRRRGGPFDQHRFACGIHLPGRIGFDGRQLRHHHRVREQRYVQALVFGHRCRCGGDDRRAVDFLQRSTPIWRRLSAFRSSPSITR